MGRQNFSSTDMLTIASALITDAPCSMACFAKMGAINNNQRLMGAFTSTSASNRNSLTLGVNAANHLEAAAANNSDNHSAEGTTLLPNGTWFHAGGTWDTSNNRRTFVNGVLEATNNAARTPTGIDNFSIGAGGGNGDYNAWQGIISDAAVWNVQLTTAEMLALAMGMSPLKVRPASLVAYWPLIAGLSPEPDPRGGNAISLVGTPSQASSGRVYRRHRS